MLRIDEHGGVLEGGILTMSKIGGSDLKNPLYCSFCGKSQHEVRKLIAGPTVFICDDASSFAWTSSAKRTSPC